MLKYIEGGFIYGIPARDLTEKEVEEYGGEKFLIKTGLYEKVGEAKGRSVKNNAIAHTKTPLPNKTVKEEDNGRN